MTDLGDLYKRYAPDVFRFALYLCGERGEAEDITSETFVRAWTAPGAIEMPTVKGYLFKIARNLHLQNLRKRRRDVGLDEAMPDLNASPFERAEKKAELGAVMRGLKELPEIDRAALLMRALDGMPYEVIARALGITLASVKVKIHRARLALAGVRDA